MNNRLLLNILGHDLLYTSRTSPSKDLKFYESFLSEKIKPIKSLARRKLRSKCVAVLANSAIVPPYTIAIDIHTARSTWLSIFTAMLHSLSNQTGTSHVNLDNATAIRNISPD